MWTTIAIIKHIDAIMRTIQMTLDDDLVIELDRTVKDSNTNRSAFARDALRAALARYNEQKLVEKHRKGYLRHPITADEFSVWEDEQAWGTE